MALIFKFTLKALRLQHEYEAKDKVSHKTKHNKTTYNKGLCFFLLRQQRFPTTPFRIFSTAPTGAQ